MERVKIIKKPRPVLALKVKQPDAFDEMADEYDGRALKRAQVRIEELEHEIRMQQHSTRTLLKTVENEAARSSKAAAERLYEKRFREANAKIAELTTQNTKLARQVARMGDEVACPDCGAVHLLNDFLKADSK